METQKTYILTGATGFLGEYLLRRLYPQSLVKVISRNKEDLLRLKEKYPNILTYAGDIADKEFLRPIFQEAEGIFHLAAFKHVRLAEESPSECIRTNVNGTAAILECSADIPSLKFVLGVSTDKASQVTGVYGATKFLMEKLFMEYSRRHPQIRYRLVRFGNIFYSTGSVVCKWRDLLEKGGEILVTDENITRFYFTAEQAIDIMFDCLEKSTSVKPYVPFVKAVKLKDLLEVMIEKYHPKDKEPRIKRIGIQPGENFHETLEEHGQSSNEVPLYTKEEIYTMV